MTLAPYTPSTAFTIQSGKVGWIQVNHRPTLNTLYPLPTDVAEVHSIRKGVPPNVDSNGTSRDPEIRIKNPLTWQQMTLGKGDWQLYSEENPGIEVVSCPSS